MENDAIEFEGEKMPFELAEKEITDWLKHKGVRSKKLESDQTESLIEAMQDGDIIIREGDLVVKLAVPIGKGTISELTFKPRIKMSEVDARMPKKGSTDTNDRINAYLSAATNKPVKLLGGLDSTDYTLCAVVVGFYM